MPAPDHAAVDHLLPHVYAELRRIAHREMRKERSGHTLQTTALVHEAYLKLARQDRLSWQNRAHFMAIAARAMREVLIDYARRRAAGKRGGGEALPFDGSALAIPVDRLDALLTLDAALDRLARVDEEATRVVEQRYFAGLTLAETAEALDLSVATTRRRWAFAKAWLQQELGGG